MTSTDHPAQLRTAACPICGKPTAPAHRPFCSGRCRNIDLGRWLHGVYRVESDEGPEDEERDAG
jgi:endogenous inhibitor of DNA gyrase (YacG/DUF329 family)